LLFRATASRSLTRDWCGVHADGHFEAQRLVGSLVKDSRAATLASSRALPTTCFFEMAFQLAGSGPGKRQRKRCRYLREGEVGMRLKAGRGEVFPSTL
jgi:hypothetical protein